VLAACGVVAISSLDAAGTQKSDAVQPERPSTL
jgi:hypothetical protein